LLLLAHDSLSAVSFSNALAPGLTVERFRRADGHQTFAGYKKTGLDIVKASVAHSTLFPATTKYLHPHPNMKVSYFENSTSIFYLIISI
jgi:hypothetical protein